MIIEIKQLLLHFRNLGIIIQFCWVPAHTGIKGNEEADKIAKKMLTNKYIGIKVPLGKDEAKSIIKSESMQRWQTDWEAEFNARHYHKIQKNVTGKRVTSLSLLRREEVVYTRLRLGHTGLNATLQIIGNGTGLCIECRVKEDVNHILFVCEKYNDSRINWQEMEGENSIHYILEEQGMKKERLDALFIFLNNTDIMKRILGFFFF